MKTERAYLCDGRGCKEMCANKTPEEWDKHPCHHTLDEKHAKNKCRRKRKFVCDKGHMMEVEK
jgi:hypothetical protein